MTFLKFMIGTNVVALLKFNNSELVAYIIWCLQSIICVYTYLVLYYIHKTKIKGVDK